jgi:hypothetical protein
MPTKRHSLVAEPSSTLLPLALSSIAGPSRIGAVIRVLLLNEGPKQLRRAPVIAEPVHSAARQSHSASIH